MFTRDIILEERAQHEFMRTCNRWERFEQPVLPDCDYAVIKKPLMTDAAGVVEAFLSHPYSDQFCGNIDGEWYKTYRRRLSRPTDKYFLHEIAESAFPLEIYLKRDQSKRHRAKMSFIRYCDQFVSYKISVPFDHKGMFQTRTFGFVFKQMFAAWDPEQDIQ